MKIKEENNKCNMKWIVNNGENSHENLLQETRMKGTKGPYSLQLLIWEFYTSLIAIPEMVKDQNERLRRMKKVKESYVWVVRLFISFHRFIRNKTESEEEHGGALLHLELP